MEIAEKLKEKKSVVIAGAGNASSKALVLRRLLKDEEKMGNVIWWVEDEGAQKKVASGLEFLGMKNVKVMPEMPDPEQNGTAQRTWEARLVKLGMQMVDENERVILVMVEEDLGVPMQSRNKLENGKMKLEVKDKLSFSELFERLLDHGYHPTELALVEPGTFVRRGSILDLFPVNLEMPIRVEMDGDEIASIHSFDILTNEAKEELERVEVSPLNVEKKGRLMNLIEKEDLVIVDELEGEKELGREFEVKMKKEGVKTLRFAAFADEEKGVEILRFADVLRFADPLDFTAGVKKRKEIGWKILVATRRSTQVKNVLDDQKVVWEEGSVKEDLKEGNGKAGELVLLDLTHSKAWPEAWQNADEKMMLVTDNEIFGESEEKKKAKSQKISLEFLASLKEGDLVIHIDHGVGRFLGIVQKTVQDVTREYLELEYAEGDRLFVPVDQADRVSKYLGIKDGMAPKLTRLGSAEWATVKKRVHKETQILARELLLLYAKRGEAKGFAARKQSKWQKEFDEGFPYEETPGQISAIQDIYDDMAKPKPMDRLVCGDVGFGKTEVAMRAAFRAVMNGKQVAVLAPITILADQHFKSFKKRMDGFPVRIAALTRFQKGAEQKEVLKKLAKGEVDIVIGTHRLLSDDVKFKDLGLLIVDEEQRFGVGQKEKLKKKRLEMDVLTLTATPIPRTLNMGLNGIRDVSTISTPPPGRLPIITEVRKFSTTLIREAVMREMERKGQVYVLHNRVETIDVFAEKVRQLVPEARVIVAHGQLKPEDLESRISDFAEGKFDVLVSSTIIENGIDLARANTLIVDRAEAFGLSQLYQLRGRIGRGRVQAYAYFLYHSQRLQPDAKARLKAVMEATELGAGFQIAMRDLEIRGAGNILGAEQSGTVDTVGVAHFTRLLNQAVEDMKAGKFGKTDEPIEITLDLPVSGFIPDGFVESAQQKIIIYQKLSSADNLEQLEKVMAEVEEKFEKLPREVKNLGKILELKILARRAGLINVRMDEPVKNRKEIVMVMSDEVKPKEIMQLLDHNDQWVISGDKLKIGLPDLGESWFSDLMENVRVMVGVK